MSESQNSIVIIFLILVIITLLTSKQDINIDYTKATKTKNNISLTEIKQTTTEKTIILPSTTKVIPINVTTTTKVKRINVKPQTNGIITEQEKKILAQLVNLEAGNCSLKGKMAVIEVIKNRLKDGRLGNSIYNIIHRPNQFSVLGFLHKAKPVKSDYEAIDKVFVQKEIILGSKYIYFCEESICKSFERGNKSILIASSKVNIDGNVFYKSN